MADDLRISVDQLRERMDAGEAFTVIDTRNPQAWAESSSMIPGALRLPLDQLDKSLPNIPKTKPIVTYCT